MGIITGINIIKASAPQLCGGGVGVGLMSHASSVDVDNHHLFPSSREPPEPPEPSEPREPPMLGSFGIIGNWVIHDARTETRAWLMSISSIVICFIAITVLYTAVGLNPKP